MNTTDNLKKKFLTFDDVLDEECLPTIERFGKGVDPKSLHKYPLFKTIRG